MATDALEAPSVVIKARGGPWAQAARRLVRKKVAFGALIVIVVLYGAGALASWVAPQSFRDTPSTDLDLPGFPGVIMSPRWGEDQVLFNYTAVGVFRSEDGGESWLPASAGIGNTNVNMLAVAPATDDDFTILAGTSKGMFLSTDSADTWESANQGLPNPNINDMVFSPNFLVDGTAYAALSGGVFRSTDGGASWARVGRGFQSEAPKVASLAISPGFGEDSTILAGVTERKSGTFTTVEEIFISTDRGDSWKKLFEASTGGAARDTVLAISPAFPRDFTVFASTSKGLMRSTDGGSTWEALNPALGSSQVLDLIVSPTFGADGTLFAETRAQGIFRSTDRGESWEPLIQGVAIPKVVGADISPNYTEDQTIYAGTAEGSLFRTTDGGKSWKRIASKDLKQGPSLLDWPPSFDHIFGTDRLGRDLFSRIIYGIRTTVIITLASVLTGSLLLGLVMGAAAGFFGGKVDTVIMRVGEIFLAFPGILLIILIAATIKPRVVEWVRDFEGWSGIEGIVRSGAVDYFVVFASLTLFSWVGMARLVRGQLLHLKESQYVEAARAMGASNTRIILRHLLPNALSPVIVSVSMGMGAVAGSEVVLSWFGIGIQPPNPSLGRMIFENFGYGNLSILRNDPHLILIPVFTIAVIIFAWNLLGDGLNDVLNPRTR